MAGKAQLVTAFRDCVSKFVSRIPLDSFKETAGQLPAVFVAKHCLSLNLTTLSGFCA